MSNTCFPPQPNRNRQAYLEGWFACRLQGLMFAIWEPQRVFTWSVIQKVVGRRIHRGTFLFCCCHALVRKYDLVQQAGIKTAESMLDAVQGLSSVQTSERTGTKQIFSVTKRRSRGRSQLIGEFLMSLSMFITAVTVQILSRCSCLKRQFEG